MIRLPSLPTIPPPHLPAHRVPRWLPWVIGGVVAGLVALTIVVGWPLLAGNDSPKIRTLARWLPIPVARVDGQLIWAREYLDYRTFIETFVARSNEAGQAINPDAPIGQQVLNLLLANTAIERAAKEAGISVRLAEVEAAFRDILILQGGSGEPRQVSEEELDRILEELYGSSKERLRDLIRIRLLQDKVKYELLEQVRFRQILVADETKARELIGQLQGGAKFEDLTKEHSQHQESRELGGEIGFVARGEQLEPIETVLFAQPVGLVTEPVKTDFGYHILEILERRGTIQQSYDDWLRDATSSTKTRIYLNVSVSSS